MENENIKMEVYQYKDGILLEHVKVNKPIKWKTLNDDPVYQSLLKNIGIGKINPMYLVVNEIQEKEYEYRKITKFLKKYIEYYAEKNKILIENLNLEFINYGKTEIVYVLTEKNGKRVTLLVKQPIVRLGDVYNEMQYLLELNKKDKNVIAPIDYFQLYDQELYVTPYINQARCVASYGTWGMYIPEPYYRFESFNNEQEKIVNMCMIAKIVSLYNFEKNEGISCCKFGGGDFMLPKGWENEIPTIENTLNKIYMIAARKKVKCCFEEYLELIKKEFSKSTIDEDESQLIINLRGRVPMKFEDIEDGINLGKKIIANQNNQSFDKILKKSMYK